MSTAARASMAVDHVQSGSPMIALDFINRYADYADVLEAPRTLHEIVAIQLVASALNRNSVSIPLGGVRHSLDLWVLLLSGSGVGRSTIVGMADPTVEAAGMQNLESSVVWGSAPAFYQHFAENPCGLYIWGEMAERLKLLNQPQFSGVKEWLTDRYDNFKTPPPFRYRRKGGEQDTPPIVFAQTPRINILATSSDDWFFDNLAETDSTGGFVARWVIVRATGRRRDVPIPHAPDAALVPALADRLRQIGNLTGDADLSAILPAYQEWYCKAKRRFEAQSNPALAAAYFNRHRGHILKLAVVFEAARTGTLTVSSEAWERAVEFARRIESTIFDLLPTGMSAVGFALKRIEEHIKQAGPAGITQNELTRAFQPMPAYDRQQRIQTLLASGRIFGGTRPTGGRTATVYVAECFVKAGKVEPSSPPANHPTPRATATPEKQEAELVPSLAEFADDAED